MGWTTSTSLSAPPNFPAESHQISGRPRALSRHMMTPTPARQITAPVMSHRLAGSRPGPFPKAGTCRCRPGFRIQDDGHRFGAMSPQIPLIVSERGTQSIAHRGDLPGTGPPSHDRVDATGIGGRRQPAPRSRRRPNRSAAPRGGVRTWRLIRWRACCLRQVATGQGGL
jgi:hypothetical protein